MNGNGRPAIDYTNKDYESLRTAMLDLAKERLPAWTDHSPNDLGVVLLELFAYMGDILFHYQDRIANESYLETAAEPRSVVNLLRLIGYERRPSQPASADLTLLFDPAQSPGTSITIETGTQFSTSADETGEAIAFQYIRPQDLVANLEMLPSDTQRPQLRRLTLPVVQVDDVAPDDPLGSSDGGPNQRYALASGPLIDASLVVFVDEGSGPRPWTRVDSLLYSSFQDTHYIVRRDENDVAWVAFGDGRFGRMPRRGVDNIRASYRAGGGSKGNVPAMTIKEASLPSLEQAFNRLGATGGTDAEPLAEATLRGPQLFRSMGRAVTAQDYEAHAREFGVAKARARAASWNRVELFVAPAGGGEPSDTLKETMRTFFDGKRMITTTIEILGPHYVQVDVQGHLGVEAFHFAAEVQQRAERAIRSLLAFENVSFQDTLYLSKVYEAVEAIEGVRFVNITRYAPVTDFAAPSLPADGALRFGWDQIPRAGRVQLLVESEGA